MKYKALISQMTLGEKASLLSGGGQFYTKTVERLTIPSMYLSDGPHGVRKQAGVADHLGLNASLPATCYPTAASMANSWNLELAEQLGEHLGEECVEQGVNVLLGPGLNIKRSHLGGRNFEYFSEDPYLSGTLAAAYIRGIQSEGISACPKHFAVNSQELRRMHNDSVLDERTLREIYLTGFEIAVKEGRPLCLMSSYNRINGIYANDSKYLLQDILRDEWGFEGFVVTDWGGSNDRVAGLVAGNHLEMPTTFGQSDRDVVAAVREGKLDEALVDQRVNEYLSVLLAVQLEENDKENSKNTEHHCFARKAAADAAVLLKNEDRILPLATGTKVAVIGDYAINPRYQGAGSSLVNSTQVDIPLDCLMEASLEVVGYQQGFDRNGGQNEDMKQAAIKVASLAEVVLLYMGLDEISEVEGLDRQHMCLHRNQTELLEAIAAVNPNVVVVLAGASPVEVPWQASCKAIVHGYLGGQAGAGAMVDILIGKVNPSGKLAETWPLTSDSTPADRYFPGKENTTEYRESIFVGYRYYQTAAVRVAFPFGFGLSFTTFAYSDLKISKDSVRFTITNTGNKDGAEIAQVYVGKPDSDLFRARRELKGFTKMYFQAGESKAVTIPLDEYAFRYFNVLTGRYEIEKGTYTIEVGASSDQILLTGRIDVEGTTDEIPYKPEQLSEYYSAQIKHVPDKAFEALLGRPIPQPIWDRAKPLERNDTFSQLFYAKGWVGRLVHRVLIFLKNKAEKKGKPDLNILFIYNMPFRGVEKMMAGIVNRKMVDSMLLMFNGHFFKGFGGIVSGWFKKGRDDKDTNQRLIAATNSEKRE